MLHAPFPTMLIDNVFQMVVSHGGGRCGVQTVKPATDVQRRLQLPQVAG